MFINFPDILALFIANGTVLNQPNGDGNSLKLNFNFPMAKFIAK